MTISELYTAQKKVDAKKNLIGTIKFFSIAMPLLLVWAAPIWFKAHAQIPVYQRDCRSAPTVSAPQTALPCYDEMAVAQLQNYYHKSSIDTQYALLNYADGQTSRVQIDGDPGVEWTHSQVDGPCLVEVWHGEVTAVLRPNAKITSKTNPALTGDATGFVICVLCPGILTVVVWVYLFVLWRRGDLKQKTMR